MMRILRKKERVAPVEGIGCSAAVVTVTSEELLEWMGMDVFRGDLSFREANGPIRWFGAIPADVFRHQRERVNCSEEQ
jgi:hypothetical protein